MVRTIARKSRSVVDEFVEQVIREMELQGVTHSELARQAECGRPYLYRVLAREQAPSLEWAEKVAAVLGLRFHLEKIANPS